MLHAYVRYRDVVLRVIRCFPDVAGAGGVEDKCVAEIPAHSAWRGLDPAPLRRHLRVVPIRILRLGNHWCSLVFSRIDSLSIRRPRWCSARLWVLSVGEREFTVESFLPILEV